MSASSRKRGKGQGDRHDRELVTDVAVPVQLLELVLGGVQEVARASAVNRKM